MKRKWISRLAVDGTVFSVLWMVFLVIAEFVVGERAGIAALLAYIPQHPLGIPVVLSLVFSLVARKPRLILVNALLALFFLFVFMGFHIGFSRSGGPNKLKVMTWNVHGFKSDAGKVADVINTNSPDVLFLQEVDSTIPLLGKLRSEGWNVVNAADVAVASKMPLDPPSVHTLLPGAMRRAVTTRVKTKDGWLDLVSVHFATNVQGTSKLHPIRYIRGAAKSRIIQVRGLLEIADDKRTIIAGDFNLPPRGIAYRRLAHRLTSSAGRETGFGYTFPSRLPVLRIDHVFTSRDLHPVSSKVIKTKASDHLPIVVEVEM